jgi:hypothetical protein
VTYGFGELDMLVPAYAATIHKSHVTLFNCFVMGGIEDSTPGIFRALQEGTLTMRKEAASAAIFRR